MPPVKSFAEESLKSFKLLPSFCGTAQSKKSLRGNSKAIMNVTKPALAIIASVSLCSCAGIPAEGLVDAEIAFLKTPDAIVVSDGEGVGSLGKIGIMNTTRSQAKGDIYIQLYSLKNEGDDHAAKRSPIASVSMPIGPVSPNEIIVSEIPINSGNISEGKYIFKVSTKTDTVRSNLFLVKREPKQQNKTITEVK